MHIFTICSKNYLARALCLYNSTKNFNPNVKFSLFLSDIIEYKGLGEIFDSANIYYLDDLFNLNDIQKVTSKYDITELNTAIKATCFKKLMATGCDRVLYLDPDIEVFDELDELNDLIRSHDAIVTPHINSQYSDDFRPTDLDILTSGTYNFGFLALNNTEQVIEFLHWWEKKLLNHCYSDIPNGLFVDQKFGELITSFVQNTHILHDVSYNVAYWNLHERRVSKTKNYTINGKPLKFFHFSGLSKEIKEVSRHQNRIRVEKNSTTYRLLEDYQKKCRDLDSLFVKSTEPGFNYFHNGKEILAIHRVAMRLTDQALQVDAEARLVYHTSTFYSKRDIVINVSTNFQIKLNCEPILAAALKIRSDLVAYFPITNNYPHELRSWFVAGGFKEFGLTHHGFELESEVNQPKPYKIHSLYVLLANNPLFRKIATKLVSKSFLSRVKNYFFFRLVEGVSQPSSLKTAVNKYNERFERLTLEESLSKLNIKYVGYFDYPTGLGKAARDMAKHIYKRGKLSDIQKLHIPGKTATEDFHLNGSGKEIDATICHCNFDMLRLEELQFEWQGKRLLYCVWELPFFPRQWLNLISSLDCILVPSKFVASNLYRSYGIKSFVLPHIITTSLPDDTVVSRIKKKYALKSSDINILISCDLDSFVARKNPEAAIYAAIGAINKLGHVPIKVIVKIHGSTAQAFLDKFEVMNLDNFVFISDTMTDPEYSSIKVISDIYISLHRSEGFGLNIAEMINLGKYVVTTGYSGNLDFCISPKVELVKYKLVTVKNDEYSYSDYGQYWAEPDLFDAEQKIIKVINNIATRKIESK